MHPLPELPWPRVAAFVRQHTHDVRNDLNSLDLEASLLSDIVTDEEGRDSLDRMRRQIRQAAARLKALSAKFADPRPSLAPISVSDLFEIWKEQIGGLSHPLEVKWESRFGEESVSVDANLLSLAFRELLENASAFSAGSLVAASGYVEKDRAFFELRENKDQPVNPDEWRGIPLNSSRRGGYGLGLFQTHRIVEAHGGDLQQRYEPKERLLVSVMRLPLA